MIVTLENAKELLADEQNPLILLSPVFGLPRKYINILWMKFEKPTRKYWVLQKDITAKLSSGEVRTIRKGFRTDLSSVPRLLHGIVSPHGDFDLAAIIHDDLYINKGCTREFADDEMLIWSNAINPNPFDNRLRHLVVERFGESWWEGKGDFIEQRERVEN